MITTPTPNELLAERDERIELCNRLNNLNANVYMLGGRVTSAQLFPEHFTSVSISILRGYLISISRMLEELVYGL